VYAQPETGVERRRTQEQSTIVSMTGGVRSLTTRGRRRGWPGHVASASVEQSLPGREDGKRRRGRSVFGVNEKRCPSGVTSYGVTIDEYGWRVTPRNNSCGVPASNRAPVVTLTTSRSPAGVR
jgi:hypothetical protein